MKIGDKAWVSDPIDGFISAKPYYEVIGLRPEEDRIVIIDDRGLEGWYRISRFFILDKAEKMVKEVKDIGLVPLYSRIIVAVKKRADKTSGGLYIPDTVSNDSAVIEGSVVSVGRGKYDKHGKIIPMDVAVGNNIIFNVHTGVKLKLNGEDLILLREEDVMAVL